MTSTMTAKAAVAATGLLIAAPLAAQTAVASEPAVHVDPTPIVEEAASVDHADGMIEVANVQGTFTFDQAQSTPNDRISSVFRGAVETLCGSVGEDLVGTTPLDVTIEGENSYDIVTGELSPSDTSSTFMTCSCAGNLPGGGAIMTAEVSGVSLSTLAERLQECIRIAALAVE